MLRSGWTSRQTVRTFRQNWKPSPTIQSTLHTFNKSHLTGAVVLWGGPKESSKPLKCCHFLLIGQKYIIRSPLTYLLWPTTTQRESTACRWFILVSSVSACAYSMKLCQCASVYLCSWLIGGWSRGSVCDALLGMRANPPWSSDHRFSLISKSQLLLDANELLDNPPVLPCHWFSQSLIIWKVTVKCIFYSGCVYVFIVSVCSEMLIHTLANFISLWRRTRACLQAVFVGPVCTALLSSSHHSCASLSTVIIKLWSLNDKNTQNMHFCLF